MLLALPVQTCYGRRMTTNETQISVNMGLEAALQEVGSQTALAKLLGKGQSTINDWLHGRNPVPISIALTLEEKFGIPRGWFRSELVKSMGLKTQTPSEYLETVTTWTFDAPPGRSKPQWVAEDE